MTWPGGIFVNGATCGGLSIEALPVARDEIAFMIDLCDDHPPNTLVAISQTLTDAGVSETFRAIEASDAMLDQVAIHGTLDDID